MFDDVIADMESNKKLCPKVIELFLQGRQLNISLLFISQSFFKVPKTIRLYATQYFIMKIPNKEEHQQIASNHSFDIDFKDFMKLYQEYPKKPYLFLVNDYRLTIEIIDYDFGRTYYKMSVSEKTKATNNKIDQNKALYNLDNQTAKISALSSGNVSKYEFLTNKDVSPKEDLLERATALKRFENSPLGKKLKKTN